MYDLVDSINTDLPTWLLALVIPLGIALYILALGYSERRYERKLHRRIKEKL